MTKRLLKKIRTGITDEKQAIDYYRGFSAKDKRKLTKQEIKNIKDAEKDEKEHLRYLEEDKKTIIGKLGK
jgi:rubrerythrin